MSLKVIHTKPDGTQVPIKVSIWDAFKGVPSRKPRKLGPINCPCCGKVHCLDNKPGSKDGTKDDAKTSDKGKGKGPGKTADKGDLNPDDHIILRMKGENSSAPWADILQATSSFRDEGHVRARFKEIKHHLDEGGKKQDDKSGKKGKNKVKNADKDEIAKKNREEGLKKKAEKEAKEQEEKKTAEEKAKEEAAANDDNGKKSTKARKDYDKNKGIFLAAKHFDKTGVRITPKEALKMAEEK